jgi:hypothetical protein
VPFRPSSTFLLHTRAATFFQQGERGLEGVAVTDVSGTVMVDPRRGDAQVADTCGLAAQPGIDADGGSRIGRSIEVGQQPAGFVQMPVDDAAGALDATRVNCAYLRF